MTLYEVFEWIVVGAFLLGSVAMLVKTLVPRVAADLARRLRQMGVPEWLAGKITSGASCDDGCHTCGKCGPDSNDQPKVIVIHKK